MRMLWMARWIRACVAHAHALDGRHAHAHARGTLRGLHVSGARTVVRAHAETGARGAGRGDALWSRLVVRTRFLSAGWREPSLLSRFKRRPCATDGYNRGRRCLPRGSVELVLAAQRSHRKAGIGVIKPGPYHQNKTAFCGAWEGLLDRIASCSTRLSRVCVAVCTCHSSGSSGILPSNTTRALLIVQGNTLPPF